MPRNKFLDCMSLDFPCTSRPSLSVRRYMWITRRYLLPCNMCRPKAEPGRFLGRFPGDRLGYNPNPHPSEFQRYMPSSLHWIWIRSRFRGLKNNCQNMSKWHQHSSHIESEWRPKCSKCWRMDEQHKQWTKGSMKDKYKDHGKDNT